MSQESWWSSWCGLSQPFTSKREKRDLSNDEEEQWWEWFCSQSTKKNKSSQSVGSSSQQKEDEPESSSAGSSLQPKEDDSKNDHEEDDTKVSFYLKVGKCKKFKYVIFLFRYKHELCKYKQNKEFHLYVQYSNYRG